jgi:hypothetical protein
MIDQSLQNFKTKDDLIALDGVLAEAISGQLSNDELNQHWAMGNYNLRFRPSPIFILEIARERLTARLKKLS